MTAQLGIVRALCQFNLWRLSHFVHAVTWAISCKPELCCRGAACVCLSVSGCPPEASSRTCTGRRADQPGQAQKRGTGDARQWRAHPGDGVGGGAHVGGHTRGLRRRALPPRRRLHLSLQPALVHLEVLQCQPSLKRLSPLSAALAHLRKVDAMSALRSLLREGC